MVIYSRHPDDLYKNGIQRSSFIPAIELLKSQFAVTDLNSGTGKYMNVAFLLRLSFIYTPDYRRVPRALSNVYYHPLNDDNRREIIKLFNSFASSDPSDPPIRDRALNIWGRSLLVPESTSKLAKFHFDDLCGQPLSAADYLEITKTFGTVFVLDVPKMGLDSKDKAIYLSEF